MVNFPNLTLDCDSLSPALLDLFLFSGASTCCTMPFPPLGNSDHVVSVSIDFPTNSKRDVLFHCIAYDCSCADCDGLLDHLRDVPWGDIFKLSASAVNFVRGFRLELICISLIISIRSNLLHLLGFPLLVLQP